MSKLSQSFKDRADEACFWEAWVAAMIARNGYPVTHMDFSVGDEADPEKAISFDLVIGGLPDKLPVDVKSRGVRFTQPESFPFESVNVCSANFARRNFKTEKELGRHFLIVSSFTGHILWLPKGTPLQSRMVIDGTRSEAFLCMAADRDCLQTFGEFIDYLGAMAPAGV